MVHSSGDTYCWTPVWHLFCLRVLLGWWSHSEPWPAEACGRSLGCAPGWLYVSHCSSHWSGWSALQAVVSAAATPPCGCYTCRRTSDQWEDIPTAAPVESKVIADVLNLKMIYYYVGMVSPLVFPVQQFSDKQCDLLEHAVTAVPLYGRCWDPLGYASHQVSLLREMVVSQVFNLRRYYTQRGEAIIPNLSSVFFNSTYTLFTLVDLHMRKAENT